MENICIIIPCFNEEYRLNLEKFCKLSQFESTSLIFINDGSTDRTLHKLNQIKRYNPHRIFIINSKINQGKGHALMKGFHFSLDYFDFRHIGFLDADFPTSIAEYSNLLAFTLKNNYSIVFGERKLSDRKLHRRYISFLLNKIIKFLFKIKIDDTQCGIKIFDSRVLRLIIMEPFISAWLFDLELILRLKELEPKDIGTLKVFPLKYWQDIEGSHLQIFFLTKVPFHIIKIFIRYKMNFIF